MWVFGYGSLVWRPDFPYLQRRPAYIRGWVRRFWQGSPDHRGVPDAPGRVTTLLPGQPDDVCWGMAYAIEPEATEEVVDHLDYRERGGYARHAVTIHLDDADRPVDGTVYIATEDNEHYLGPAEPNAIARQIASARGPSGENTEYLLRLAEALRAMQADDPHVFELESALLALTDRTSIAPGRAQPLSRAPSVD